MEKYLITGSLGNISKPIAEGLVKAGKNVTIITSDASKVSAIEKLGAKALVGSVQDAEFVKTAFKNIDVVYTMIPPIWQTENWRVSQNEVGNNYAEAIKANGVKYVVNLSSVGAESKNGNGPVDGLHDFEQLLNDVKGLHVKHLRPGFFYYNFLAQIELIRQAGIMGANYGDDDQKLLLVDPKDIAAAALEEMVELNFTGNSIRYVISDERSGKEIAEVIGRAIGKELSWVIFTDQQQLDGLLKAGLSKTHSEGYTQMGIALRTGKMSEYARKNKPTFGPTKLEDFAKSFEVVFGQV